MHFLQETDWNVATAIALMSEFEPKMEAIANSTIHANVTNLSGVPSWMLVLVKHILEKTGKQSLEEVCINRQCIRDALLEYCGNYPSQNRASESLNGVSAATVSQICNQKYTSISDDMFSRIAAQIGFSMDRWTFMKSGRTKFTYLIQKDIIPKLMFVKGFIR